jgi:hypothetical protein
VVTPSNIHVLVVEFVGMGNVEVVVFLVILPEATMQESSKGVV